MAPVAGGTQAERAEILQYGFPHALRMMSFSLLCSELLFFFESTSRREWRAPPLRV